MAFRAVLNGAEWGLPFPLLTSHQVLATLKRGYDFSKAVLSRWGQLSQRGQLKTLCCQKLVPSWNGDLVTHLPSTIPTLLLTIIWYDWLLLLLKTPLLASGLPYFLVSPTLHPRSIPLPRCGSLFFTWMSQIFPWTFITSHSTQQKLIFSHVFTYDLMTSKFIIITHASQLPPEFFLTN